MASPFRVHARESDPPSREEGGAPPMRVEFILVLALTTPVLVLGIASHRSFGVALTVGLFAWIFAFVSLMRTVLRRP